MFAYKVTVSVYVWYVHVLRVWGACMLWCAVGVCACVCMCVCMCAVDGSQRQQGSPVLIAQKLCTGTWELIITPSPLL